MKKAITKGQGKEPVRIDPGKRELLHRIKEALKQKGKTAYWLANSSGAGISYNTIHKYLNNTMEPSLSNLKKIADALGLKGGELLKF